MNQSNLENLLIYLGTNEVLTEDYFEIIINIIDRTLNSLKTLKLILRYLFIPINIYKILKHKLERIISKKINFKEKFLQSLEKVLPVLTNFMLSFASGHFNHLNTIFSKFNFVLDLYDELDSKVNSKNSENYYFDNNFMEDFFRMFSKYIDNNKIRSFCLYLARFLNIIIFKYH